MSDNSTLTPARDIAPTDEDTARQMVIAAASHLFYARGFTAVGMDELRTVTGMPLKRLYRLFPSKEAIIEQVLQVWQETWETSVTAQVESTQVPRDRLLAVFDFLAVWFSSEGFRGCAFINSFGELGASSGLIAGIVRDQKKDFQDYLAQVAAGVGAPETLAPQLAILAEGAVTTAAISARSEPARQARAAAEVLIDAAMATVPGNCCRCHPDSPGAEGPGS
ncbi:TetR/AcrR family transcriptional regulator [Arthrobacter sp. PAMC25284]|uniref:TetR/AcrR family transcriptional regulator n=1 Tax=Arthrobacter sp. PAMC25284 TaxID=2861279 RepID=UPI001C62E94D|nr:TetR/AcrR family transcriptional regulator [Arthrobacter sp. PAMC25284]QYF89857.1 TetR/AcrR family transcriptional regulator [Arthrobacter sp. PAMC25284]